MSAKKDKKNKNNLQHERVNNILLGFIERPLLAWFVRIMPNWVTSDMLTFSALFACILIFISYYLCKVNIAFLWLASFGFILNWFGDSLDGSLARYRKTERPRYGFFIDHTMDALGISLIFMGFGVSPYAHISIAVLPLVGYLMMEVHAISALYTNNIFKISYGRMGPTEARALAIIINIVLFFMKDPTITLPFGSFLLFDCVLAFGGVLLVIIYIVSVAKVARALLRVESQKD